MSKNVCSRLLILLVLIYQLHVSTSNQQTANKVLSVSSKSGVTVESIGSNDSSSNPCRTVVSFVNGIYHTYSECQEISDILEGIFDENVRVFYNPSTGNWISDAYRAGLELIYKPDDLLIAKDLALHLRKALKDVGTTGNLNCLYSLLISLLC
jgi:hypothetical protein